MDTDIALRLAIEGELSRDNSLRPCGIVVRTGPGVVTLTGNVPAYALKCVAEEIAGERTGSRMLFNDIQVCPSQPVSDAEIASNAMSLLRSGLPLSISDIKVDIKDGWLTLEGWVLLEHERRAAEQALQSLAGVKGIFSKLHVRSAVAAADVRDSQQNRSPAPAFPKSLTR